jgi:hypothetical protein
MDSDYSLKGLLLFLDLLDTKGLANQNTVRAIKIAVNSILGEIDEAESADVRKIDVPVAVRRFNNKNPGTLSPNSLAEYQRRVAMAVKEFEAYTENPTAYQGFGRRIGGPRGDEIDRQKPRMKVAVPEGKKPVTVDEPEGEDDALPLSTPHLSLAFPLRADFLARVVIPRDLRLDEAKRLGAFLATLAADYKAD